MFNSNQKRIFDKIKQHLTKQKQQEDMSSDNDVKIDDIQPLRMFIRAWEIRENGFSLK